MRTSRLLQTCLAVGILWALSGLPDRPAYAATVCDCPDVSDLINRLNMAEAALAALQAELPKIQAADKQAGRASSMADTNAAGQTNQDILRSVINGAMADVQMLGGQTSRGETGGRCGSSVEVSSTACIDEIVMFHEDNVHVPACTADRAAGRTTALGFRAPQTTVDYVKEEMAGYQSEITKIREVLRSLPASCRLKGWVGTITYTEVKTMDSSTTVNNPRNGSTSTKQSTTSLTRQARILFRETGTPRGNVYVKEVMTMRDAGSGRDSCKAGLATPVADTTVTGTVDQTTDIIGAGEDDVTASFDFNAQTGQISLSFEIPGLVATATLTRTESVQGACNPAANGTKTSPGASFSTPYGKTSVNVDGVTSRGLDVIRGSKTLDLGPRVSIPGTTASHRAQVSWALYRVN